MKGAVYVVYGSSCSDIVAELRGSFSFDFKNLFDDCNDVTIVLIE